MESNFISAGGNSLLALNFIEKAKQCFPSTNINSLFDLLLHRHFKDMINYLIQPNQQEQSSSQLSTISTFKTQEKQPFQPVWSIQRCSKIFFHSNDGLIEKTSVNFDEKSIPRTNIKLQWKSSMKKCIDASPVIVLLDQSRHFTIIGSHAGLVHCYRIDNGELIWSFQANERIEGSGAISRDGKFVMIGKSKQFNVFKFEFEYIFR